MAPHGSSDNLELDADLPGANGRPATAGRVNRQAVHDASTTQRPDRTTDEALKTVERRLTRLVLDLHDGPLQDVIALGADLRHFREQLSSVQGLAGRAQLLLGRIDDLDARLVVLAEDLREIASSASWPTFLARPFNDAVTAEVERFEHDTKITVARQVDGDFDALTASQRIALLRVLEEALANIRQHSGARNVGISMNAKQRTVHTEIVDDGRGFDLEGALVRAARDGRLGIVGMAERVRLLGGKFDIDTHPGGPTRITITLYR